MRLTNAQKVWFYSRAPHTDRAVLYAIATAIDLQRPPEAMRKAAKRCGLTREGYRQIVARLVEAGEVEVKPGGGRGRCNTYKLGEKLRRKRKVPK